MAINPIEILKDTIDSVSHTVTITSIVSLGSSKYQLNAANTFYLRTAGKPKTITIDAADYVITDFVINSYITVIAADGTDQAVTAASFTISPPLFVWGNPQMVSAELVKRMGDGTVVWPYMWIVEIGGTDGTLDPAAAVTETRNFQIFFLDSADKVNWTIEQHYDNDIYTLNNYIEYFFTILKSRRDLFETDSITYSKDNYINFGDYIVDEGMKQHILNGEVTGIQLQISIPFILGTCNDASFLAPCPDVTTTVEAVATTADTAPGQNIDIQIVDLLGVTVSSTLITDTANTKKLEVNTAGSPASTSVNTTPIEDTNGGNTKVMTFQYANGDPIVVTEVTDTELVYLGTVPDLPAAAINTSNTFKTGADTSYRSNDDGDLERGRGADFFNTTYTNPFGHSKAYSGTTGGYYDEVAAAYKDVDGVGTTEALAFPNALMLNWKSYDQVAGDVFCIEYTPYQTGLTSAMITGAPYTIGGFTGFYVSNILELYSFFNYGTAGGDFGFGYAPLSFAIGNSVLERVASSTAYNTTNNMAMTSLAVTNQLTTAQANTTFRGRYLNTITDLGL